MSFTAMQRPKTVHVPRVNSVPHVVAVPSLAEIVPAALGQH